MTYLFSLKNFIHTILVIIFSILIFFILITKISFWWSSLIVLLFLLLWKMISGLANINFFILFVLFFSSTIFSWNFEFIPVAIFFITMIMLFYFRVIDIKPEIKKNIAVFLTFKQIFLFLIFFTTILALYCVFYLNHWPFWLVFIMFSLLSYICFSWYKKLNNINWSLYEKIVMFITFLQISWFLFNFSNGFFIFPMLMVFWFYNIIEIYKHILNWTWSKTVNLVLFPIIITMFFSFLIKL